jgi:hypothetical protein
MLFKITGALHPVFLFIGFFLAAKLKKGFNPDKIYFDDKYTDY